jgi:hypothetical protein
MASTTKANLEATYGVPVYVRWHLVPTDLHPRSWYADKGVKIPKSAKPDAVKGGGQKMGKSRITFLFRESKWL